MIWMDNLFAVPAIGIRMNPNFNEVFEFQKRFGGFFEYLIHQEKYGVDQIKIESQEIWGYSVTVRKTGFLFVLTPRGIVSQFLYEVSKKEQPGGLPKFELPEPMLYSQALEKVRKYIEIIFGFMKDLKGFQYDRIGVVASVGSDKDSLPPGILRWLEYLGKPLGNVTKSEASFLAKFQDSKENEFYDQCHHLIRFDDSAPEIGYRIVLDWQRMFDKPKVISDTRDLVTNLNSAKEEAIKYFQKFGEGDLNYD